MSVHYAACEVAKDPDVHMLTKLLSNLICCVSVMLYLCVISSMAKERLQLENCKEGAL